DSIEKLKAVGSYQKAVIDTERTVTVVTDLMAITFSTKGGQHQRVELKKFNGPDSTPVKLASTDFDKIDYSINSGANSSAYISNLNFHLDTVINKGKSYLVKFTLQPDSAGPSIHHQFD